MPPKLLAYSLLLLVPGPAQAQGSAEWVTITATAPWHIQPALRARTATASPADVTSDLARPTQTIRGFGACFNELGWTALSLLPAADRDQVFRELFAPGVGTNFTICRMPVGANDFARDWNSYDETPGDFAMQHFSIATDRETLIPFIKQARRQYPALRLWASPWSPPTWMRRWKNDWTYCRYTWELLRHYLGHGASAYLYWNMALREGGLSRWGWRQNSLLTVDEASRSYRWTHEYYLLKHLSHYVLPGARRLATSGKFDKVLAFRNPDKRVVLVAQNPAAAPRAVAIQVGRRVLRPRLPADSFSTLVLR